jgi:outer membrane protein assembly factor BamD
MDRTFYLRGRSTIYTFLLLGTLLLLPGCGAMDSVFSFMGFGGGSSGPPDTPEGLVMEGMDDFNRGKYSNALEIFDDIRERFPFSPHSLLAELKAADCSYYLGHYPEAIVSYEEFEVNHPTNEAIPYVLFQIARSSYKQIDTIDRDPGAALDAIAGFSRLLKSFPESSYRDESRARVHAARNFLANHEMYVAAYYLRTEEYDQSESRLKYLLENYPKTSPAAKAQELLAAIQSGNPPQRTWRDWIPDISLPDWKTFSSFGKFGGTSGSGPPQ